MESVPLKFSFIQAKNELNEFFGNFPTKVCGLFKKNQDNLYIIVCVLLVVRLVTVIKKYLDDLDSKKLIEESPKIFECDDCPICTEHMENPISTNCGHTFCLRCLYIMITTITLLCPMCRAKIYNLKILRVENEKQTAHINQLNHLIRYSKTSAWKKNLFLASSITGILLTITAFVNIAIGRL